MVWPNQVGYGQSLSCPDNAVDTAANRGEGPSPMQARCTYSDAVGPITQITGQVRVEVESSRMSEPLEDVEVRFHRLSDPDRATSRGQSLATTKSGPGGSFSTSARLPRGTYLVVVEKEGRVLSQRTMTIEGEGARRIDDLLLLIPASAVVQTAKPLGPEAPRP